MVKYYMTLGSELVQRDAFEPGVWVYMQNPAEEEIAQVCAEANVDPDFIRPALDEEERPRIETDNGHTLILVDIPTIEEDDGTSVFTTIPLGIVYTKDAVITVCLKETPILNDFIQGRVKQFLTQFKSRFVLQILFKNATLYLLYLRSIEKQSTKLEHDLQKSMRNKELTQLLRLEKSLVYFSTSLKSNETVLEKMLKFDAIKRFEEDQELLDDVIIENKQAIEMTTIYSNILSSTMDAFASIISNNLNIVMKSLTIITIAMSVPTVISGLFGMNVPNGLESVPHVFWYIVLGSALLSVLITLVLSKNKRL